ncbi:MAG: type II toxin-antitoxin system HigB family toxin [Ottowia sp.]|uniref:type II toxin-antitoxin system HigB family toxin n=1 Tax=Ottowia sp. TaxID=1898956 RepID=UPI0039E4629C
MGFLLFRGFSEIIMKFGKFPNRVNLFHLSLPVVRNAWRKARSVRLRKAGLADLGAGRPVARVLVAPQQARAGEKKQAAHEAGFCFKRRWLIHGNPKMGLNFRLVVAVVYRAGVLLVKFVGTHERYDRIDVATVEHKA